METKNIFFTSDLELAATLLTLGYDILSVNPVNPKRVEFFFDEGEYPEIQSTVNSYWRDDIDAKARSLFINRRELLTRVKEASRQMEVY